MIIYSIITTNNNQYYSVMFGANNKTYRVYVITFEYIVVHSQHNSNATYGISYSHRNATILHI